MTTIALNSLIHGTPAFLNRLSQGIASFFDGIGEARAMAEHFKTLSRMSDAELARRGITRDEIPQVVISRRW
jgi:uncharacterized protein YjiS (DUF1127 family)